MSDSLHRKIGQEMMDDVRPATNHKSAHGSHKHTDDSSTSYEIHFGLTFATSEADDQRPNLLLYSTSAV